VDELVEIAGPVLAPESEYAERVARRRKRRMKRKARDHSAEAVRLAVRNAGGIDLSGYAAYHEPDEARRLGLAEAKDEAA
jgi:hypothetical protein